MDFCYDVEKGYSICLHYDNRYVCKSLSRIDACFLPNARKVKIVLEMFILTSMSLNFLLVEDDKCAKH